MSDVRVRVERYIYVRLCQVFTCDVPEELVEAHENEEAFADAALDQYVLDNSSPDHEDYFAADDEDLDLIVERLKD